MKLELVEYPDSQDVLKVDRIEASFSADWKSVKDIAHAYALIEVSTRLSKLEHCAKATFMYYRDHPEVLARFQLELCAAPVATVSPQSVPRQNPFLGYNLN